MGVKSGTGQVFVTAIPLVISDLVAILFAGVVAILLGEAFLGVDISKAWMLHALTITGSFLTIGMLMGLYPATGVSPVFELRQSVLATAAAFVIMFLSNACFGVVSAAEWVVGCLGGAIACVIVPIARLASRKVLSGQSWWGERAVIIGSGPQGRAIYRFYNRATERGLRPLGVIDTDPKRGELASSDPETTISYLGSVSNLERLRRRMRLRWAVVAPGGCEQIDLNEVMRHASNVPNLLFLPSQFLLPSLWASTRECAGVMGVHLRDHLRNPVARIAKRCVDIAVSFAAILVLSPVFLIIALLIKIRDPGPVFYGHTRVGLNGTSFKAWKFRSMVVNADEVLESYLEANPVARQEWIEDQKLRRDPRIIDGIGGFLRKTSLDELPQLFNVLLGHMSVVGPRPIVTSEIDRYREMYPLYLRVRPGITGLWQISGRNDTSYEQRVRLDSYYVCNWSVWLDTYIMLRTMRTLVMREGAY